MASTDAHLAWAGECALADSLQARCKGKGKPEDSSYTCSGSALRWHVLWRRQEQRVWQARERPQLYSMEGTPVLGAMETGTRERGRGNRRRENGINVCEADFAHFRLIRLDRLFTGAQRSTLNLHRLTSIGNPVTAQAGIRISHVLNKFASGVTRLSERLSVVSAGHLPFLPTPTETCAGLGLLHPLRILVAYERYPHSAESAAAVTAELGRVGPPPQPRPNTAYRHRSSVMFLHALIHWE
ncbi:hypothetical protein BC826DRAFT_1147015 [Russula brevipes]|nr:hypothetical protein BC826DRAFT_1147015 [Russula brevipes]